MKDPCPPLGDFLVWLRLYKRHKRSACDGALPEAERLLHVAALAFAKEMLGDLLPSVEAKLLELAEANGAEARLWNGIAARIEHERSGLDRDFEFP